MPKPGLVTLTERDVLALGWALNRATTFTPVLSKERTRLEQAQSAYEKLRAMTAPAPANKTGG